MTPAAVDVCVDLPRLELDRPFTYFLRDGPTDPTGYLVSVPFHGRTVKGWVLGPARERPRRVLPVRRVLSAVPLFRHGDLRLYRRLSERYVAPLATVIGRAYPPRVASEENRPVDPAPPPNVRQRLRVVPSYEGGERLLQAGAGPTQTVVLRPRFDDEAEVCVEAVEACLGAGSDAIVVVPEAEPLPATARAVLERFGASAVAFVGGDARTRYRTWLEILGGRYRVVVGTRPSVFAPLPKLGLVWINREAHTGHREERAPHYSTRDVAVARADLEGATCVLAGFAPSAEAAALLDDGRALLVRPLRARERSAAPLVELAAPREEDRSPRLAERLRAAGSAFLLLSRRGYGAARLCKSCGEPARCAVCSGTIAQRGGRAVCAVCGAPGRCASCGGGTFAIERGGTERLEEWARRLTKRPVERTEEGSAARSPTGRVVVGTPAAVKDFGPVRVDLVAILDPDRSLRRARLSAQEQALATWFEAAGWAGPRTGRGRVLVQTREAADPAIQALVRWDPSHFHRAERRRRAEAGFPPGFPVFRVEGKPRVRDELASLAPFTLLASSDGDRTVCLTTLRHDELGSFRALMCRLAEEGTVTRVEAEPHL